MTVPKADGTIPEEQRRVLLGIGQWLKTNGEAIYATRPWVQFGEGPTRIGEGKMGHFIEDKKYTPQDIHYTRSKQAVFRDAQSPSVCNSLKTT